MNREEAVEDIYKIQEPLDEDGYFGIETSHAIGIINKICDDFENRTCETCDF